MRELPQVSISACRQGQRQLNRRIDVLLAMQRREDHLIVIDPHQGGPMPSIGAARRVGREAIDRYLSRAYVTPLDELWIALGRVGEVREDPLLDRAGETATDDPMTSRPWGSPLLKLSM